MIFEIMLIAIAYLIGSIPTGYLFGRYHGIHDIRQLGSGTIGATNVSRAIGARYFFLIFAIDAFKAGSYLWYVSPIIHEQLLISLATALLLGNTRSCFLYFTGGKGVATLAGILIAWHAFVAIILLGIWACVVAVSRIVGVASLTTLLVFPGIWYFVVGYDMFFWWTIAASSWCIWMHKNNIRTLLMK